MSLHIPFDNTYSKLPERFFARLPPVAVEKPEFIALNDDLAVELGIDPAELHTDEALAIFAGNAVPQGADPIAQAYAAHQFGNWVPQLGDGRALMLGEVVGTDGIRRDIQLKGSGRTPFSLSGDGRAWLGPVIREYVVSEAMHALGIPTTRALAAVTTGQNVQRETALPGAVLTRVAASHIRVGTFQYFAARQDTEALQTLVDYVIDRHYPDAKTPMDLLDAVMRRQASLIAKWMAVGFIHGVMNTDNTAISGETIDYGPCAYMDAYHPETVFSSIDQFGRYAYHRQPDIAAWNLAQFASCLLPLMGELDPAVELATAKINEFPGLFKTEWRREFGHKLGLADATPDDEPLIEKLLEIMAKSGADFTNTFRALSVDPKADMIDHADFPKWFAGWQLRLKTETGDTTVLMQKTNPVYIPRNHRIEQAIQAAVAGDFMLFRTLNTLLQTPFDHQDGFDDYRNPPLPEEVVQRTFCGT